MAKVDKLIVTNRTALGSKYSAGLSAIDKVLAALAKADKARGLTTMELDLANAAAMKPLGAPAVTTTTSASQNKKAIDAAYRHYTPDYLMILGAPDVVPHQPLVNPAGDEDVDVPSDLPYACDRPYSSKITDFLAPTRVVGRLPDLPSARNPAYVVALLATAAGYRARRRADYDRHLAITAKVWLASTALSTRNLFGPSATVHASPKQGPKWTTAQLGVRSHFINCHGAPGDFHFYGEPGFPSSHESPWFMKRLANGTVAAAECCYGGELYDPAITGGTLGICLEYLRGGAYGFFGSTNIAYGPPSGNGQADVITQDFLKHVLSGASLGRAALQTRQDYILKTAVMGPTDLKTIAQFYLLADPAIHAVVTAEPRSTSAKTAPSAVASRADRAMRREALMKNGLALGRATNYVDVASGDVAAETQAKSAPSDARRRLTSALGPATLMSVKSFDVVAPAPATMSLSKSAVVARDAPTRVYFALGKRSMTNAPVTQYVAAVVRETEGVLGEVTVLHSR